MHKERLKSSVFFKSKKALLQLMGNVPFDSISVKDICGEANFSRQYFYRHYIDKLDLVRDIFINDLAESMEMIFSLKNSPVNILKQLQKNGWFYHALFSSSYYAECYKLFHAVGTICLKTLYKITALQDMPEEFLPVTDFYLHGVCTTIAMSFSQGKIYVPTTLAELFYDAIPPALDRIKEEEITGELLIHHIDRELERLRLELKIN